MQVTLIGSGNVATVLGRMAIRAGHTVVQVYSRNMAHARQLAEELHAAATGDLRHLDPSAGIYILAVPDDSLPGIADSLRLENKLMVHTAGSVSMDVLRDISPEHGVLYPLQSLRKEIREIPVVPFLTDAASASARLALHRFATSLSPLVENAGDEQRRSLHLAAVIASNFSNHLFTLTEKFCRKEHINFNMLLPLLKETIDRLAAYSPEDVQTGPAARNDQATIARHRAMLKEYPQLLAFYDLFTSSIRGNGL